MDRSEYKADWAKGMVKNNIHSLLFPFGKQQVDLISKQRCTIEKKTNKNSSFKFRNTENNVTDW